MASERSAQVVVKSWADDVGDHPLPMFGAENQMDIGPCQGLRHGVQFAGMTPKAPSPNFMMMAGSFRRPFRASNILPTHARGSARWAKPRAGGYRPFRPTDWPRRGRGFQPRAEPIGDVLGHVPRPQFPTALKGRWCPFTPEAAARRAISPSRSRGYCGNRVGR